MRVEKYIGVGVLLVLFAGCDLLNQTPIVVEKPVAEGVQRPLTLSKPDSVLKLLTYLFDRHTPEAAREYGELLYEGYVYRYDDPTDNNDLELDRASEIRVYENIFRSFETITAEFTPEERWIEYGSRRPYPPGTPQYRISDVHPDEDWTVVRVLGEMTFTNTNERAEQVGYRVRQRFDLAFRLDPTKPDSTWQLASWTDRESLLSAKPALVRRR